MLAGQGSRIYEPWKSLRGLRSGGSSLFRRRRGLVCTAERRRGFRGKVNELLGDEAIRKSMGDIGRERVIARLTWEHSKEALLAAYNKAYDKKIGAMVEATP